MTKERIEILNELNFVWDGRSNCKRKNSDAVWYERYEELEAFALEYGHCDVPQVYPDNPKLGFWVHVQRASYQQHLKNQATGSNGKQYQMDQDRINALELIGFSWKLERPAFTFDDKAWFKRYDELVRHKEISGSFTIQRVDKESRSLGNWCSQQKKYYKDYVKGKATPLKKERIEALQQIGFFTKETEK